MALARDGASEGIWLRADAQTGGRGRSGRAWVSPPGNLYASTLVRLRPGDPEAPGLALVAGVALEEVASAYAPGRALMLKWPNDLLCDGAKLAGILLEREGDAVVAGIGVNLAHHPDDLERPATDLGGGDPEAFLADLADAFARWVERWRAEGLGPVVARRLARARPIGTAPGARAGGSEPVSGLFDGLEPSGALRLRLADGTSRVIQAGDIFLL